MRRVVAIALSCAFFVSGAMAVREVVIIDEPQLAQRVEGVVLDPTGAPIPDMTVTDRTEIGVAVLRSTKTDRRGHFHHPPWKNRLLSPFRSPLVESFTANGQARQTCCSARHYSQAAHRRLTRWV